MHGNTKEEHAKRTPWEKCYRNGCKAHRSEKINAGYYPRREGVRASLSARDQEERTARMQSREGGERKKNPRRRRLPPMANLRTTRERDILQATIRLQDKTIGNQQRTIETQRTTIEAGDTTIAMLKRQWIGEQRISKRIRRETPS